jgi:hypothetical protein
MDAVKRKHPIGLYISIGGAVLVFGFILIVFFLIISVAGSSVTQNDNNSTNTNVSGVYPPNGMQIPMYYQYDYPGILFGSGNISTSGCAPTTFAMVATYLLGRVITPPDVVAWSGPIKYYVPPAGTRWDFFEDATEYFQCGDVKQTNNPTEVLEALSDNRPVICSQGPGLFTSGGHFIVLRGITTNGKVLVNDPNDNANKNYINREFELFTDIHATANAYWIFDQRQTTGTGAYQPDFTDYTQAELELIWAIVQQEDNKTYEGALAVISCAANRVESAAWNYCGNNILAQLTAPGQFCYSNDAHWLKWLGGNVYPHVKMAVEDCLKRGIRNHNYTCFRSTNGGNSDREQIGGNWYFN